ncbi:hypothetical protein SUGI_1519160 [Cryptomeria japonica]|uniref:ATP synthase YMF19-like N-terminal domain-containing protein n=1 Tax=Cryptomeria japonica TaxID=3369 RepID=A0AAD3RQR4_CRYJA|nr:hypothetical protein SUGI_1447260 [Cryptomeria japonica]GLJ59675.1 hypothetical protein SUGI_1518600 [Cryptomeria japonica]GLJ59689.1 hypothetical protein SUGI_1519160 [Cryptomeria japonica]
MMPQLDQFTYFAQFFRCCLIFFVCCAGIRYVPGVIVVRLYLICRRLSDPISEVLPPWFRVLFPLISRFLSMLCSFLGMEGGIDPWEVPIPNSCWMLPSGGELDLNEPPVDVGRGFDLNETPADVGRGFDLNETPADVGGASSSSGAIVEQATRPLGDDSSSLVEQSESAAVADLARFNHSENFPERFWWGRVNSSFRLGRENMDTLFHEMAWRISSEGGSDRAESYVLFADGWACHSKHFVSRATTEELTRLQQVIFEHCIGARRGKARRHHFQLFRTLITRRLLSID